MKILYAGELKPGSSSSFRRLALERLGHEVVGFDPTIYVIRSRFVWPLAYRLAAGPHARRMNRDLLETAEQVRPDLFWADKVLLLTPETLKAIQGRGALSVSYMIDNAFGPRHDPGWRMYRKTVPFFDLHVTQRDVSLKDYRDRGARDVMKVQTAYEPTVHFPSPVVLTDADRVREVSFIGTPYDDRASALKGVLAAGYDVWLNGAPDPWRRALGDAAFAKMHRSAEIYGRAYREAIWRSRINLSFLTHSNQDEYTHKSFEIAGCGGFLMAERSEGHRLKFVEDEEAVFFSGTDELLKKIKTYLPDEAARTRIAAAGRVRAVRDGYDNDRQEALILERVREIAKAKGLELGGAA